MPGAYLVADAIEILLLSIAIYGVLRFMRSTRGVGILRGLFTFTIGVALLIGVLDRLVFGSTGGLPNIKYIVGIVSPLYALIVVVLFQEELRQGISRFGQGGLFRFRATGEAPGELAKVATSARRLANQRIGALIAVERQMSLKPFSQGAVPLDLPVTSILLETIFFPGGPMHDGGVVLRGNTIVAASCIFPLTTNPEIQRRMGTRHRAAIGLTEVTDAVVLVVSEETGELSLAADGELHKPIPPDQLERRLQELLKTESKLTREEGEGEEDEDEEDGGKESGKKTDRKADKAAADAPASGEGKT